MTQQISTADHPANTSKRNYGIDLLRLAGGLYVITGHTFGQAGIISNLIPGSLSYKILWWVYVWIYCAVELFLLISGYTSVSTEEKEHDWSNVAVLWLEVVFYSVAVYIIMKLYLREPVIPNQLVRMFFPILNISDYWFFASYIALFTVKPILDRGIKNTDEKLLKQIFWVIIALFCCIPVIRDPFFLVLGYSPFWFIVVYALGAIIKKCRIGESLSTAKISMILVLLVLVTWLIKCYGPSFYIFDERIHDRSLISYTSPTVMGIGISHLLIFSRLKLSGKMEKIIRFASPSVFALYLINTHPLYWNQILKNKFADIAPRRISVLFPRMFLYIASFFISVILIDKIRQFLFSKLEVKKRIHNLLYRND